MILPSKKVLSTFLLIGAMVAAVIIAFGKEKSSEAINFASDLVAGDKVVMPQNPDWYDEIANIKPAEIAIENSNETEETTVTGAVSTSLISNYLALKESGSLDSASAQKLIDQSLDYINNNATDKSIALITQDQLKIIADNGNKTITDYGENLGTILKGKKPSDIEKEIGLITKIVSSRKVSDVDQLNPVIASYEKIYSGLIKMPVPKTFVKAHLDMTNGTMGMVLALKQVREIYTDPFKALLALQLYQTSIIKLSQPMQATIAFLMQNKVVYKQGSGGYYLLYGI